jgi:hypothetical protein
MLAGMDIRTADNQTNRHSFAILKDRQSLMLRFMWWLQGYATVAEQKNVEMYTSLVTMLQQLIDPVPQSLDSDVVRECT